MIRSVFGKMMWLGRTTSALVGLVVLFALAVGAANSALAHTNVDNKLFHLGHSNSATTPTSLISTLSDTVKSALVVQNKSGGPALDLRVGNATTPANDVAPMKVNSSKVVGKLNADQLDGKHAADFLSSNPCPSGTLFHEGACIETSARPTNIHSQAEQTCLDTDRRLPTVAELQTFRLREGQDMSGPEWTSNTWRDVADSASVPLPRIYVMASIVFENGAQGAGLRASFHTNDDSLGSYPFRCVGAPG